MYLTPDGAFAYKTEARLRVAEEERASTLLQTLRSQVKVQLAKEAEESPKEEIFTE